MNFDILHQILTYDPAQPMLFSGMLFWLFFAFVLGIYSFIYKHNMLRISFLFAVSLFFYYKSGGICFWLLIISTIIDFLIGLRIGRTDHPLWRRMWLIASLTFNLGVLAYFKYTYFVVDALNALVGTDISASNFLAALANANLGTHFTVDKILLPVGISFYTFQTMSYSIDIYRKKLSPVTNIIDFGFYVSFFPQLVAGPIVRASEFIPQIRKKYELTMDQFGYAVFLIINGLIKKIVISDYLSTNFVDRVFESPESFTGFENLTAVYAYALQIYCDFSGYTDIAIGVALLLGYQLAVNFNSPYKSSDITEFWRRWHISLSPWLRDYVYISLGGNRKGTVRTYINLMLTMLVGGLWHGAHLRFIVWGALHGAGLAIHKLWIKMFGTISNSLLYRALAWFLTFHFVCFAWMFFRAESIHQVMVMLEKILFYFTPQIFLQFLESYTMVVVLMLSAFAIHLIPFRWKETLRDSFISLPVWEKAVISIAATVFIYQFKTSEVHAFIYFQF